MMDGEAEDGAAETAPLVGGGAAGLGGGGAAAAAAEALAVAGEGLTLRQTLVMMVPMVYVPGFCQSLYDYVADPVMPLYATSLGCTPAEV